MYAGILFQVLKYHVLNVLYVLKYWSIEVLKYWSIEVLKYWSIEVLKYWSIEVLKYHVLYVLYDYMIVWLSVLKYNVLYVLDVFQTLLFDIQLFMHSHILRPVNSNYFTYFTFTYLHTHITRIPIPMY